jgi:hydrogenase maturation factor HypE
MSQSENIVKEAKILKMVYEILYKNSHIDVIEQEINEENIDSVEAVNKIIQNSMKGECEAYITLGNGETVGNIIRVSDISRVKITYIEKELK